MSALQQVQQFGKPFWIVLSFAAFLLWWPLGLAAAAFGFGSGRLRLAGFGEACNSVGRWHNVQTNERRSAKPWFSGSRSSGNRAFDEYREDTLRRLEAEQREFRDFLERLRRARDQHEFDQFMKERGQDRPAKVQGPPAAEPLPEQRVD